MTTRYHETAITYLMHCHNILVNNRSLPFPSDIPLPAGLRPWRAFSKKCRRRVAARIEATYQGLDTRYVVTNISHCGALYESV